MSSDKFRDDVIRVQIMSLNKSLTRWRKVETIATFIGLLFAFSGGLLAFSEGYFNYKVLSFLSGSFSFASLSVYQFAAYAYRQSKKLAEGVNKLLIANDEKPLPDLEKGIPEKE